MLIAIPVFNEEAYVARVLARVKRYADHVLVIDDGSTDATPDLLARTPGIEIIRHPVNAGYGRSLIDAFAFASRHRFDWLITMDCDEQHEAAAIPQFTTTIADNDADIISGSRYLRTFDGNDLPPPERRQINRRITAILNHRFGWNLTDAFCGFKACRVATLGSMGITEPGYAMPMQFWAQAAALHARIRELPVRLVYNDLHRSFGGELDDATLRYQHYLDVFETEVTRLFGERAPAFARDRARNVHRLASENHAAPAKCCTS